MLKTFKERCKDFTYQCLALFIATIGKILIRLLLSTCRWKVTGLDKYIKIAKKEKCIIMLWHNRLTITPFILHHFAPQFIYAAFISKSRDGELLGKVVRSYKIGRVIHVPHHSRHEALRQLICTINEKQSIAVITPDGPRGPRYKMKPGLAMAALETEAYVISLNWRSTNVFTFNTWDQLRLPKPFSTIEVVFGDPLKFNSLDSLSDVQNTLEEALNSQC
jgi:lysophospholipid acyltransferase (LPLAT)-like uncharacterized protein